MKNLFSQIKIIHDDGEILAISKPKGLVVHGDGKTDTKSLADWILKKYPNLKNIGEDIVSNEGKILKKPGIVHRLDKDTTGIILIAKTEDSYQNLKSQFQNRTILKNYRCFVYGEVKFDKKVINTPIGRSKNDFRKWSTTREMRGEARPAETHYELIKKDNGFSYLNVFPKTGRTHQIRVHLKYDNHPILADHLYAGKNFDRDNPAKNLNFTTQALHAYQIKFKNLAGESLKLTAPLPEKFQKALTLISS